jgi:hypothetical protein
MNFFGKDDTEAQVKRRQTVREAMEESGIEQEEIEKMMFDRPVDMEKDVMIDLERTHCKYVRFNGRPQDDNLEFND